MSNRGSRSRTERRARRAKANPVVDRLARAGLGARATVYLVLSFLCADIALTGGQGKQASTKGVLEELAAQPAGPALLVILAVGFACYAGWRLLQAVAGDPTSADEAEVAKRVGWGAVGVAYLALCFRAAVVVAGSGSKRGDAAFSYSRKLLGVPAGRELLALVGLAIVAGGIGLAGWAATQGFERYIEKTRLPQSLHSFTRVVETFGQVTRGLVFAAIGASMMAAAVNGQAKDAKGMDGALRTLLHQPYGRAALAVVAAGLASFGAASLLEAFYREV